MTLLSQSRLIFFSRQTQTDVIKTRMQSLAMWFFPLEDCLQLLLFLKIKAKKKIMWSGLATYWIGR